jgi:penicillin-binding protein 1A
MSDVHIPIKGEEPSEPIPFEPPRRRRRRRHSGDDGRPSKPRLRKLRLLALLVGLATLAAISLVFGVLMSVASDIPQLENQTQYRHDLKNSFLYDDHWRPIGLLAPPNNVVIDQFQDISPYMRRAIISVEDKRFWSDPGVDLRGIGRAFVSDIAGGATQGASTIAQQFVKNALSEQSNRTVLEKLREAAIAYHLTRKWRKQKILKEYLNTIYFGSGAYGIESAARVYFGKVHGFDSFSNSSGTSTTSTATTTSTSSTTTGTDQQATGCGDSNPPTVVRPKCAAVLQPWEAALLAGMVADPSAFDPVAHPEAARQRRNLVLLDMFDQRYITRAQYRQYIAEPLPTENDIQQPSEPTAAPYFSSWLRPQILAAMGLGRGVPASVAEYRAYYGGLKIRTSLDLKLQQAADQAVSAELPYGSGLPQASMVAIDNKTGEVRAMVGGPIVGGQEDFTKYPFNLATQGHRQPGSSFKPFTLAAAIESGQYSPSSIIDSAPQDFIVPNSRGKEHFIVRNFGNTYSGPISLQTATDISDNTVFSQVGIHVGTKRIARLAHRMGIRSPLSTNYSMILGGLKVGVSPLDMAHAYESFATGGKKVFNPVLGTPNQGPTGLAEIQCPSSTCKHTDMVNHPVYQRVLPAATATTVHDMLAGVVQSGTGTQAAISGVDVVGKTGTTTNYADAWFVGWTPQLTVAVWVGFPDKLVPMTTLYNGQPVEGGTYPAIIWHSFVVQALQILATENAAKAAQAQTTTTGTTSAPALSAPAPSTSAPSTATSATPAPSTTPAAPSTPAAPAPAAPSAPAPAAPSPPAPSQGTGSGGGTGGGTGGGSSSGGAGVGGGG